MRILIVNGSHREGNSDLAIARIKNIGKSTGLECDEIILRKIKMNLPDGCASCAESERCSNEKDEFEREWLEKIKEYDGYIFVTPTWDNGPTPLMKIFIDRLVCYCHKDRMWFRNKMIGVVTHGLAGKSSWEFVTRWVEGVCDYKEASFVGSWTFSSGSRIGEVKLVDKDIKKFI